MSEIYYDIYTRGPQHHSDKFETMVSIKQTSEKLVHSKIAVSSTAATADTLGAQTLRLGLLHTWTPPG